MATGPRSGLIIFVAVLASLLEIIDTSIVNVALPTMMGNLGCTLEDISMIITGYAIANAIVLPASAWAGERFGRRRYFLTCIALFTVASVACGLAPNLFFLIVFRIIQGLMGGALLPTSQALIYEQFPKEKAGMAGAIFGMSVMIGPALGPVMGGYLTDNFGWRSIFNINLPMGLLALSLGLIAIQDRTATTAENAKAAGQAKQVRKFDGIGLALLVLGIGALQFVLERGEADDWFSSNIIVFNAILATVCLPAFVWWELRVKSPILNVRLLKERIVLNGISLMACLGFFLYGLVFLLPVFVGLAYHYTATQTGVLFIPGSILTAFLMPFIGKAMTSGVNPKKLIFVGLVLIELCVFSLTTLSPLSSQTEILRSLYIRGLAMAFMFVPINSAILSQFSGMQLGEVSGLLNLFRQLGGSAGVALVATLLSSYGHQNRLDLAAHVSLLNPATQQAYYPSVAGLAKKTQNGLGMAQGSQAALRTLNYRLEAQVFMLSFNQLIWTMGLIFSLAFIPWYLIKLKRGPVALVDAH